HIYHSGVGIEGVQGSGFTAERECRGGVTKRGYRVHLSSVGAAYHLGDAVACHIRDGGISVDPCRPHTARKTGEHSAIEIPGANFTEGNCLHSAESYFNFVIAVYIPDADTRIRMPGRYGKREIREEGAVGIIGVNSVDVGC